MTNQIAILNTSILTADGSYQMATIDLERAIEVCTEERVETLSAIGHQSTADILTELLGFPVSMNRIMFEQAAGQSALVFKLNGRPEEGKILSREDIEKIGYSFKLLSRIA